MTGRGFLHYYVFRVVDIRNTEVHHFLAALGYGEKRNGNIGTLWKNNKTKNRSKVNKSVLVHSANAL